VGATCVEATCVEVTCVEVTFVDAPVFSGRRALDNAGSTHSPGCIFDNPSRSAKRKAMKKFIRRLEQL
jgi:hypothetical protein